jgi:exodeoxyribonuclease-3
VICLQETKATSADIDVKELEDLGFHHHWFSAQKKGYSGVAVFTKIKPDEVSIGSGHELSDFEGRVIQLQFGEVRLINAYFPSGTSGDERQDYKYIWLKEMHEYLEELKKTNPKIILCGDYNIAHKEIDIHDPKGNKKSSGFLPEERDWMESFLGSGWVDTFREFNKGPHHYSWWSQRFPSVRLNNKGWRIDYITVTEPLRGDLVTACIYPDVKHSDHCPIYAEVKI